MQPPRDIVIDAETGVAGARPAAEALLAALDADPPPHLELSGARPTQIALQLLFSARATLLGRGAEPQFGPNAAAACAAILPGGE